MKGKIEYKRLTRRDFKSFKICQYRYIAKQADIVHEQKISELIDWKK